jgi:hypothetical protein
MKWSLPLVQREGEVLQSSISTLSSHGSVIEDGFTGIVLAVEGGGAVNEDYENTALGKAGQ